jgi:hypothetical protein
VATLSHVKMNLNLGPLYIEGPNGCWPKSSRFLPIGLLGIVKMGPKGFTLGANSNFFTFHMEVYVAQIWRQNFGPKQGKWAKVFLGPNYKTWAHMRLGPEMDQRALY